LTESVTHNFLQYAKNFYNEIEPVRVLRSHTYHIGQANVLIRTASLGKNNRYFFGLNYINAEEVANLDNSFFAFICGSIDQVVIIPSAVFMLNLPLISHDRNGEYKIVITKELNLALTGRNQRLDCSKFINAWELLSTSPQYTTEINTAEESIHSVIQGRLLEIGKIRGYQTFCPNKSKKFNNNPLSKIATLPTCPQLQFSDYELLRQIDVLWFREKGDHYIPQYAFEVELSTGTWPGVGRMATMIDYADVKFYIISNDYKKFKKVVGVHSETKGRYKHIETDMLGKLYAAELNLQALREDIGL